MNWEEIYQKMSGVLEQRRAVTADEAVSRTTCSAGAAPVPGCGHGQEIRGF